MEKILTKTIAICLFQNFRQIGFHLRGSVFLGIIKARLFDGLRITPEFYCNCSWMNPGNARKFFTTWNNTITFLDHTAYFLNEV